MRHQHLTLAIYNALAALLLLSGCSGDDSARQGMSLKVASFDLAVGKLQRFQVGVVDDRDELVLVGGSVALEFRYFGDGKGVEARPSSFDSVASFVPLAGQQELPSDARPEFRPDITGVYRTDRITFPASGFWELKVSVIGRDLRAVASFEVAPTSAVPRPGDRAPATQNPLRGSSDVPIRAIDSRANASDDSVPDTELHRVSIADALATRTPLIVVVSTPTFCQSRFCGPITDSLSAIARTTPATVAFVHLEVWQNYEASMLNPAAQEWIDPSRSREGNEPWVFAVDRTGLIVERFDNVASDADLRQAVSQILR